MSETIRPYLETGGIVLCDRYADSTYAYQGYGLGRDLDELRAITAVATGGLMPDLTFYLELPVEEGLTRKRSARGRPETNPNTSVEWNRLDARDVAYHQRVADGFQALIEADPLRWRRLDALQPIDEVAFQIVREVEPLLEGISRLEPKG